MSFGNAKSLPDFAKNAIITFSNIMSNNPKDIFEDVNRINKGELFVLQFLAMRNTTVLPSELSVALNSTTGRISALLGVLEKKGHIERDIDKNNRRNILVSITKCGRERVATEMGRVEENLASVFIGMGEKNTEDFLRLLEQFYELMQQRICTDDNTNG